MKQIPNRKIDEKVDKKINERIDQQIETKPNLVVDEKAKQELVKQGWDDYTLVDDITEDINVVLENGEKKNIVN